MIRLLPLLLQSRTDWMTANNSDVYLDLVQGLRHECGFAAWTGGKCAAAETSRTPGYPLFLAIFPSAGGAIAAQAVLWSGLCFMIGLFAGRRWGRATGIAVCLMLALDVSSFVYSNKIMTEVLFSVLLATASLTELMGLERSRFDRRAAGLIFLSSFLLACAVAVRPIAQMMLPLSLLFAVFIWRGAWHHKLAIGVLVVSLPVLFTWGWKYRNWKEGGVNTLSTVGAVNLYDFRAAGTIAYATGSSLETVWQTWDQSDPQTFTHRGLEVIRQHPFAFAYLTCRTFLYLAVVPDRGPLARVLGIESEQKAEDPGSFRIGGVLSEARRSPLHALVSIYRNELDSSVVFAFLVILQLGMTLLIWTGVAYTVRLRAFSRSTPDIRMLFMLAMALLLLILASGPEATDRFRIPAMPFLAILSGIGWSGTWSHSKPKEPLHRT